MYCMKCGTKLPDDAKFCFKCGSAIALPEDIPETKENASLNNSNNDIVLQEKIEEKPTPSPEDDGITFSIANRFNVHFSKKHAELMSVAVSLLHIGEKQVFLYRAKEEGREPYSFQDFLDKCIEYCRPAFSFCFEQLKKHRFFDNEENFELGKYNNSYLLFEREVKKINRDDFVYVLCAVNGGYGFSEYFDDNKGYESEDDIIKSHISYGSNLIQIICSEITFHIYDRLLVGKNLKKTHDDSKVMYYPKDGKGRPKKSSRGFFISRYVNTMLKNRQFAFDNHKPWDYAENHYTTDKKIALLTNILKMRPLKAGRNFLFEITHIIETLEKENIPLDSYKDDLISLCIFIGCDESVEYLMEIGYGKQRTEKWKQWLSPKDNEGFDCEERFMEWLEHANLTEKDKKNLLFFCHETSSLELSLASRENEYINFANKHLMTSQEDLNRMTDYWIDGKRNEIGLLLNDLTSSTENVTEEKVYKELSLPFLPLFFTDGKYKLPLKCTHMSFFGIGDNVEFIIESDEYIDWARKDITFYNIKFDQEYEKVIDKRNQSVQELLQQGLSCEHEKEFQKAVNCYAKADYLGFEEGTINLCNLLIQGYSPDGFEEENIEKYVRDRLESTNCDKYKALVASILAPLYEEGKGGSVESVKATKSYKIMCESGDMSVLPKFCEMYSHYGKNWYDPVEIDKSLIPFISQLADSGNVHALVTLAESTDDLANKESYYKRAIELEPGDSNLTSELSKVYMGMAKKAEEKEDYDECEHYLKLADDLGNTDAAGEIALLYAKRGLKSVSNTLGNIFGGDGNKKDDNCFITTAVCSSLNKPDDCDELMTMRWYRDKLKSEDPDMTELIKEYYRIAPGIVKKINQKSDAPDIYRGLWENSISRIYRSLKQEDYRDATLQYIDMFESLCGKFETSLSSDILKRIQSVRRRN